MTGVETATTETRRNPWQRCFDGLTQWENKGGLRPWLYLPLAFLAYFLLDLALRGAYVSLGEYPFWQSAATGASALWALALSCVAMILPWYLRRGYLGLSFLLFGVLTVTHTVFQGFFRRFFTFSNLAFASDGMAFGDSSYLSPDAGVIWAVVAGLLLMLGALILTPGRWVRLGFWPRVLSAVLVLGSLGGVYGVHSLCLTGQDTLTWESSGSPQAIYESFYDSTGAMLIAGLYQYTARDAAMYFGLDRSITGQERKELEAFVAKRQEANGDNEDTGRLAGKNLMVIQLESIDTWMLTEEYMPNLYALKEQSMVFAEHFTPAYITAGTLNTEFIVNTGLLPAMGRLSVTTHERNAFPYSMAEQFKRYGYRAESFHGSEGTVYNRSVLHPNLGYGRYHSGMDMDMNTYQLDSHLMAGYEDMTKDAPFFSFIITYSGHGPYSAQNGIFKQHEDEARRVATREEENYLYAVGHAMETDLFVKLLVEQLEADGLLDDTVLVFYADHYNYYMMDDKLNMELKEAKNMDMLQKTDFFIYAKGEEPRRIESVSSSLDVLPTISNLFNLRDNGAVYLGRDILSGDDGMVAFLNGSYYSDGSYHKATDQQRSAQVQELFRMSNLILQSDYFKK